MDWSGIAAASVGAFIALAGVGLAEFGQWRRARSTEKATLAARAEDRQAELWEISLPAAGRVQDLFATVIQSSLPPSPWEPEFGTSFEEGFAEWWESKVHSLQRDIALIPSPDFREFLTTTSNGVGYGWALSHKAGYAPSYRNAVLEVGRIAFEVSSAWMRDEQVVESELRTRVDAVAAAIGEADEQYRIELEDQLNPKGYVVSTSVVGNDKPADNV